ncbi:MAG: hypothetical protein LUQ65_15260 [Candidatus Helarchaeota archaeon]|nr:hypothetical protein [Candidatus Helarchaeota archaeon]
MQPEILELIEYMIRQQFSLGGDLITDRMKKQRIHVTYAGRIIQGFIELLTANIQDILTGNCEKYLGNICNALKIDAQKILQAFLNRTAVLEAEDKTPPIIVTSLFGELLGNIRERAFNETLQEIKTRLKKREGGSNGEDQLAEVKLDDRIAELFQRNDDNISLLYNLSFLEYIAVTIHSEKVRRTAKILLGKYINRVVETLTNN